MPTDLPVLVLIAVAATAVAVAVLRRTAQHETGAVRPPSQAHRPGLLAGAMDTLDASIGMYLLRRILGRSTTTRAELVDPARKAVRVTVPADQMPIALGKSGTNARLAYRLTGARIEVVPGT